MARSEILIKLARQGEQLGHTLTMEQRDRRAEFPKQGMAAVKHWAACSCGWRSRPSALAAGALGAGFHHLGKVAGAASSSQNGDTPKIAM